MSQPNKQQLHSQPIYLVNFEAYLRPKQPHKIAPLQQFVKPQKPPTLTNTLKRLKFLRWLRQGHAHVSKRFGELPLPGFLSFLRSRNDDGLCKRKTGFEIYCELASIHGFHIFVDAKTWQRVLWWLLICGAVFLSLTVLIMSHTLNEDTPTIRYVESNQQSTRDMPFPALTICSLNRASKERLLRMSKELRVSIETLQQLPWLGSRGLKPFDNISLHQLTNSNFSWSQLLEQLSPQLCQAKLLRCKWHNKQESCQDLFQPIWTSSHGQCCSFNYKTLRYTADCGYATGLIVRMATQFEDYGSAMSLTTGFEIMLHDSYTAPYLNTPSTFVANGTDVHLMIKPYASRATHYLGSMAIDKRRCLFPHERTLFYYPNYTPANCLAECRMERVYQRCGCVPPYAPRRSNWRECNLTEVPCLQRNENDKQFTQKKSKEDENGIFQYLCDCWPPCEFYRYEMVNDVALLDDNYPVQFDDNDFFKDYNASAEVLLHVYYDTLNAEQLRLDIYENWLTFLGTFGGITGLFMGCSFVSVFELIFFTCIRPICNWLTKQEIRYRLRQKRRRQVQAAAAEVGH